MDKKEIKSSLLDGLGNKLAKFGFNKKPRMQAFYRNIESGWACVHISFIDHTDDFDVTVDMAVRFDEIEDHVNRDNKLISDKEKKRMSTLGIEIGNLSVGEQKRWSIDANVDLSAVIDSILTMYEKFGEPYLNTYSSMEHAYALLSSNEKNLQIHSPFRTEREKRVKALAYYLGKEV